MEPKDYIELENPLKDSCLQDKIREIGNGEFTKRIIDDQESLDKIICEWKKGPNGIYILSHRFNLFPQEMARILYLARYTIVADRYENTPYIISRISNHFSGSRLNRGNIDPNNPPKVSLSTEKVLAEMMSEFTKLIVLVDSGLLWRAQVVSMASFYSGRNERRLLADLLLVDPNMLTSYLKDSKSLIELFPSVKVNRLPSKYDKKVI